MLINSLPTDKFLNLSKLKAFGDDKINVTEKLKFVCARVKIIVGKGENAGKQSCGTLKSTEKNCIFSFSSKRFFIF